MRAIALSALVMPLGFISKQSLFETASPALVAPAWPPKIENLRLVCLAEGWQIKTKHHLLAANPVDTALDKRRGHGELVSWGDFFLGHFEAEG